MAGGILHRNTAAGSRFVGNAAGTGRFASRSATPVQVVGQGVTEAVAPQVTGGNQYQHKPAHLVETNVGEVLTQGVKPNLGHLAPPAAIGGPVE